MNIDKYFAFSYNQYDMKRDLYSALTDWKQSKFRKPLILKGARQVGKTYLLKEFGRKEFESTAYLNFERDPALSGLFRGRLDPGDLVRKLSIYLEMPIQPGRTLIIFDEVQDAPEAIGSLKYFQEEAPEYHVVAAGSLLGLLLNKPTAFPVGKTAFFELFPLTFGEFLEALGKGELRRLIDDKTDFEPLDEVFHRELIDWLKRYYFVGGMPEAVARFAETRDLARAREGQLQILAAHELDFRKHAGKFEAVHLAALWDSIPSQLARENKRFRFSALGPHVRAREYRGTMQWFVAAGLVLKCSNVKMPRLPLVGYREEGIAKAYFMDVGLLAARLGLTARTVMEGDRLFVEYHGALAENFVAQELAAAAGLGSGGAGRGAERLRPGKGLFYWTSAGTAEVDFLVEADGRVYPLEVKAGISSKKKSLLLYGDKFAPPALSRATLMNFRRDGVIRNYPLYAVSRFPSLEEGVIYPPNTRPC
jgi:predicted AAA+ superfamily ATPase